MTEHALTPEQEREIDGLQTELAQQIARTNVDLQGIGPRLRESQPRVERQISDDQYEVELTIDLSAIVATLQFRM